jgi:hypothetical protein
VSTAPKELLQPKLENMSKKKRRQLRKKAQQDQEIMEDRMRHLEAEMKLELVEESDDEEAQQQQPPQASPLKAEPGANALHSPGNVHGATSGAQNGPHKRDTGAAKVKHHSGRAGVTEEKSNNDDLKKRKHGRYSRRTT